MTRALPPGDRAAHADFGARALEARKMRILYIARRRPRHGFRQRLRAYFHPFEGQDGFFLASLCAKFQVTVKHLDYLVGCGADLKGRYDWILINHKSSLGSTTLTDEEFTQISSQSALKNCKLGLVCSNAAAWQLPSDENLDRFDVVFKRECLRDLDRYKISASNKAKLHTTMLPCPLISPRRLEIHRKDIGHRDDFAEPEQDFQHDVFFSGAATNPLREAVVRRLLFEDLNFLGGIQYKRPDRPADPSLASRKLSKPEYIDSLRRSKINLAMEGYGELTYRHLEIWYLSSFMISTPSIGELQLPIDARENEHYVAFHSIDDLVDKIRYYLDRPEERERIASSGKALFSRCYDLHRHGDYISACLRNRPTSLGVS